MSVNNIQQALDALESTLSTVFMHVGSAFIDAGNFDDISRARTDLQAKLFLSNAQKSLHRSLDEVESELTRARRAIQRQHAALQSANAPTIWQETPADAIPPVSTELDIAADIQMPDFTLPTTPPTELANSPIALMNGNTAAREETGATRQPSVLSSDIVESPINTTQEFDEKDGGNDNTDQILQLNGAGDQLEKDNLFPGFEEYTSQADEIFASLQRDDDQSPTLDSATNDHNSLFGTESVDFYNSLDGLNAEDINLDEFVTNFGVENDGDRT